MNNQQIKQEIDRYLKTVVGNLVDDPIKQASAYSLSVGGKRVRPMLLYYAMQACQGSQDWRPAAAAIELVHTYSLIHDDLPAMDDDDLRRGHPTVHKAYDEATAILVGDGLQALAFEQLAQAPYDSSTCLAAIETLAKASGLTGMVLGQSLDINGHSSLTTIEALEQIHQLKTGALICASLRIGGLIAGASPTQLQALARYGRAIGLAFQVVDDILDVTADSQTLGKPQGSDLANDKATYVSLLGLSGARAQAKRLHEEALTALREFDQAGEPLRHLAQYIIERQQ